MDLSPFLSTLRYKQLDGDKSQLIVAPVKNTPVQFGQATKDFQFASAVAAFGMLLRKSEQLPNTQYATVLEIANTARGEDQHGYCREFIEMVTAAGRLAGEPLAATVWSPIYEPLAPSPSTISYYPPTPVYHSPARESFVFRPGILIGGIGLSLILILSATVTAVVLCARLLVLPSEPTLEQTSWPCTAKQRDYVPHKPPVRSSRALS